MTARAAVLLLALFCASFHLSIAYRLGRVKSVHSARISTTLHMVDTVVTRCKQRICDALEVDTNFVVVQSTNDDPNGPHITVECVSSKFEGLRTMQRQQLIYKALWQEMTDGGAVHAVDSIIAKTPQEVGLLDD